MSANNLESQTNKKNWLIHLLYVRQDYNECLRVIEDQLKLSGGKCEYPLYVKALIKRLRGEINESLHLFQSAAMLNPNNVSNLKQVARSLYLLGKHKDAIELYDEATKHSPEDWEIFHNKGLCYLHTRQFNKAEEYFSKANAIQKHDATYLQLGKVYSLQEKYQEALDIYLEALEFSPENPDLLTTIGILYLRLGKNYEAFDYLGNSLSHDPRNPKTILAAGSIIQDQGEMDVALTKYRTAAKKIPNSAQLWNNIGMCFLGKQNYIASIACLKRALYLAPFEWIIAYNLGLVHLNAGQYASAFHYFSASINLKADFASSYMYLGMTLSKLDDFDNACSAFEKAIEMESDHLFELNYAIVLYNYGQTEASRHHFLEFEKIYAEMDEEERSNDPTVEEKRQQLASLFSSSSSNQ